MNDPDEHTLDEAWGEDPAVPDQARPTGGWLHYSQHGECVPGCSGCTLERVEAAVAVWESELASGAIRDPNSRWCWQMAVTEMRRAVAGPIAPEVSP